jgi:mannan endo-1,4-beta-mannosidase
MVKFKLSWCIVALFLLSFLTYCGSGYSGYSDDSTITSDSTMTSDSSSDNNKTYPQSKYAAAIDGNFVVNGKAFWFAGTNAYYLPEYEHLKPKFVNKTLDAFQKAGIKVVRMWGYYDGPPGFNGEIAFQPKPGVYKNLQYLDQVVAKGKECGISFIITFVNYWKDLGGICRYNVWAGGVKNMDGCHLGKNKGAMYKFIHGDKQQKWYKDYIKMLLNRTNTVTGVKYKDEPAIFSWEIINEGRNPGRDPSELRDWYQEIAQYIKSIDSNHMVDTGEEGFDYDKPSQYSLDQYSNKYILKGGAGSSYIQNTAIPEIDFGGAHWYPNGWGYPMKNWGSNHIKDQYLLTAQHAWMKDHINIAHDNNKPFFMGEYGFSGGKKARLAVYKDFWNTAEKDKLGGSLVWEYVINNIKCGENKGNICWPSGRKDKELYDEFKNYIKNMNNM